MKGKKQPFLPIGTPVSHEILAKLRSIWKRFFWNWFNTTIMVTKCQLNLFKSSRISCGCERVKFFAKFTEKTPVVESFFNKVAGWRSGSCWTQHTKYYKDIKGIKFINIKWPVQMLSCSQILVVCKVELFHRMFNWFEKLGNINMKKHICQN